MIHRFSGSWASVNSRTPLHADRVSKASSEAATRLAPNVVAHDISDADPGRHQQLEGLLSFEHTLADIG